MTGFFRARRARREIHLLDTLRAAGYPLTGTALQKQAGVSSTFMYPLLARWEREGLVRSWGANHQSPEGRRHRYYEATKL